MSPHQWKVQLDATWDVLGPFPIHAREQHFLSPAYPINLSEPIDYDQTWPSSYADNGVVRWSSFSSTNPGLVEVKFPNIRWHDLRKSEGWAALQHHAILRTTLTVVFPSPRNPDDLQLPKLAVNLEQASYFAVRPQGLDSSFVPAWYPGDVYAMDALPALIELSNPLSPSNTEVAKYDLFISGDYEIRLFGDPLAGSEEIPTQRIRINVDIQPVEADILYQPSQDVLPDFVNGFAFGPAIGIGIQSTKDWWTVIGVFPKDITCPLGFRLLETINIAPSQIRLIPIVITQTSAFFAEILQLDLILESGSCTHTLSVSIRTRQHDLGDPSHSRALIGSFFFANFTPSRFVAVPPRLKPEQGYAPILALHGAGVDVIEQDFWIHSLPDNKFNWMVVAVGRTPWGLDWHGISSNDAWESVEALVAILQERRLHPPDGWIIPNAERVIIVGHSNGGQGAWYIASRFPDKVLAVIPAAAYIKSQSYIPLTLARSGHFIDPSLKNVLESALTPDDNDLHISNMVDIPVLAIHGGDDENVPVWHSRELISLLKSWYPNADAQFHEDPGKGHWYPHVFNNQHVQMFLARTANPHNARLPSDSFTLTVSLPQESGSLHGWTINKLSVPGRLGRLHVTKTSRTLEVESSNVQAFSLTQPVHVMAYECSVIVIDGCLLSLADVSRPWSFCKAGPGLWEVEAQPTYTSAPSRLQSILASSGPLIIVASSTSSGAGREVSAALRVAHVLRSYHRLDAEIINEDEALFREQAGSWKSANIVFIGTHSSDYARVVLRRGKTPVRLLHSQLSIDQRTFDKEGQAMLFLHPHPTNTTACMLFILYSDTASLERATRLFPFRTGVAVPSWVVIGGKTDKLGAGGIEAAGVWGPDWTMNEAMAWFH